MEFFGKLGSLVGDLWKKYNYDELYFPEVANTALLEMPPNENISFDEVASNALTSESLPEQADMQAEFGQPPLTAYLGRDFRIEVLFWTGATPAIHQHAFSGAFHVMHGSSIHITWKFDFQERVSSHLHFGRVAFEKAELLKVGDNRLIHSGKQFIHTTFHLDRPTVSIVVRTTNEQDQMPQYSYLPPSLCYNARDNMHLIKRKCQLLAMLVNADRAAQHDRILNELFAISDTFAVFHYLYQANMLRDKATFDELLQSASGHHAKLVANMAPAMAYLRRQTEITKLRSKTTDQDLRFFLALLINVSSKDVLLTLLKERYPQQDSVLRFCDFVKQLSNAEMLGEKFSDPWLLMLECLLRGSIQTHEIEYAFAQKYGQDQVANQRTKIANLAISVSRFWLLRPLIDYDVVPETFIHRGPIADSTNATKAQEISA